MNRKPHGQIMTSRASELTVLNELISTTHTWIDPQAVLSNALEQAAKLASAEGAECHLG